MKRLLCVFAHPDDECLGPGGTIAQCVLDGGEVFITTFTAGEAGTIGISKTLGRDVLAGRRRAEMDAACAALGVAGHRILGAPDRGLDNLDPAWAVGEIVADIRSFRPQVLLTFHHLGVSGHPDHIAVSGFVDKAFGEVTDGPLASYGWGIPASRAKLYERPNLVPLPDEDVVAQIPIGPEAMERKIAAIRAHVTQIDFFLGLEQKFDYRQIATPEFFTLERSRMAPPGKVLTDLWEGIDV